MAPTILPDFTRKPGNTAPTWCCGVTSGKIVGAVCPGSLSISGKTGGALCLGSLATLCKADGAVCPGSLSTTGNTGGALCLGSL